MQTFYLSVHQQHSFISMIQLNCNIKMMKNVMPAFIQAMHQTNDGTEPCFEPHGPFLLNIIFIKWPKLYFFKVQFPKPTNMIFKQILWAFVGKTCPTFFTHAAKRLKQSYTNINEIMQEFRKALLCLSNTRQHGLLLTRFKSTIKNVFKDIL